MRQSALFEPKTMRSGEVPALVRVLGKLVIEVLPAALASVIGAFLFAHYQFESPAATGAAAVPTEAAVPASAAMMQLLREEHAMIGDYLTAQQDAEKKRMAAADAADAADARVAADAKLDVSAPRHAVTAQAAEKPAPRRGRQVVAAAAVGGTSGTAAQLPTVLVAGVAQPAGLPLQPAPAAEPAPRVSFVGRTLAVSGRVVAVALHAVMAVGGIPSWIGHRVGATDLDTGAGTVSASS